MAPDHKVLKYIQHHSVYPLVGIGTTTTPLPPASLPYPPDQRWGGGHTRRRLRGWGSPNSDDLRKSLALCLPVLCAPDSPCHFHSDPDPFFGVKMLNFYLIERRLYAHFLKIIITVPYLFFFLSVGIFARYRNHLGMLDSVLWIRITLMRIRIRFVTLMRTRMRVQIFKGSGSRS
jgi:hypothetical protein